MKRIVFKTPDRIGHIQLNDSENASAILQNVQQNEEEPLLQPATDPKTNVKMSNLNRNRKNPFFLLDLANLKTSSYEKKSKNEIFNRS